MVTFELLLRFITITNSRDMFEVLQRIRFEHEFTLQEVFSSVSYTFLSNRTRLSFVRSIEMSHKLSLSARALSLRFIGA